MHDLLNSFAAPGALAIICAGALASGTVWFRILRRKDLSAIGMMFLLPMVFVVLAIIGYLSYGAMTVIEEDIRFDHAAYLQTWPGYLMLASIVLGAAPFAALFSATILAKIVLDLGASGQVQPPAEITHFLTLIFDDVIW